MKRVPLGMVHGRFQPFHNEHLDYVLSGLGKCDELIIGITNPDPTEYTFTKESNHRHQQDANPFSFYERFQMVKGSLVDVGANLARVTILPFHLFDSSKWPYYIHKASAVVQFVREFSSWEQKKIEMFEDYGFHVNVIDVGCQKTITATEVRRLLVTGGDWRALVPNGTARVIDRRILP